jgi:hypothetical protein
VLYSRCLSGDSSFAPVAVVFPRALARAVAAARLLFAIDAPTVRLLFAVDVALSALFRLTLSALSCAALRSWPYVSDWNVPFSVASVCLRSRTFVRSLTSVSCA